MPQIGKTTIGLMRRSVIGGSENEQDTRILGDCDLPCPWCSYPASEHDARCPGCGRRFG